MKTEVAKKTIAIMVGQLTQGGSERQLYFFLQQCDRGRWEPIVYVSGELGAWEERIRALGVRIVLLESSPLAKMRQFRRSCQEHSVSCFFSWSSYTNGYGLALAGLGISRIGSFRNNHLADLPSRLRWLWSWMSFNGVSTAICNSQETYTTIRERAPKTLNVIYIPNAVEIIRNIEQHRACWRERLELETDTILVVGVGRLTSQKNFARFIDTIALVYQHTPIRAVIAGPDAGCKKDLEQRIAAHNLPPETVRILGSVPDARELICAADIFMLSSDYEGMPNVVMEAMSVGVPCVCTSVNGITELIEDGVSGFTVEQSARSLASKIELLATNGALRLQIGQRAAERMRSSYDTAVIETQLWKLCDQL